MKKLLYLLLLLPLGLFTACDKDDDLAPFDMTITLSGVTQVDNTFYIVAGETFSIDNFQVKGTGDKNNTCANVMFFLGGSPLFPEYWPSEGFQYSYSTAGLEPGVYTLGVTGNLLQVDASIMSFASSYRFVVVGSEEDLPDGAPALGTYSAAITYTK